MTKKEVIRRRKFRCMVNTIIASVAICIIMVLGLTIRELKMENEKLNGKIDRINHQYELINNQLISRNEEVLQLQEIIDSQDSQLINLSDVNQSMVDELNQLRTRAELYNKYEYAVIDELGKRTELTYEEIKLGETLMLEKGYDPHLMMGSIMVESHGSPDVVNYSSGATGYGQFLNSTAEWVWTKLMGKDNYYSDLRKDGETNIRMMAEYYDYLYDTVGSTYNVVKCYSGNQTDSGTREYLRKLNSHTRRVGVTVE